MRPPDVTGPAGAAWRIDLDARYATLGRSRQEGGDVTTWIVQAPWARRPVELYAVLLNHLRPLADRDPPTVRVPHASHEFWISPLPVQLRLEYLVETGHVEALGPLTYAAQIGHYDDVQATREVERSVVRKICRGQVSPCDWEAWARRFGTALLNARASA